MPAEQWGWRITPRELESWIVAHRPAWWCVNKPAGVVCHPSKQGPWSSLAGAAREFLGSPKLHMPFRLDRETSGVMLLTGDEELGKRLQRAVQNGQYRKQYTALLMGRLRGPGGRALPIGLRPDSPVRLRRAPLQDGTGQPCAHCFCPASFQLPRHSVKSCPPPGVSTRSAFTRGRSVIPYSETRFTVPMKLCFWSFLSRVGRRGNSTCWDWRDRRSTVPA